VVSLIVFGLAVALLIAHLLDSRSVPRGYVLAAFIASAIVAAGDMKEPAGQVCATTTTTVTTTTTDSLGMPVTTTQTYPVETCAVQYTLRVEALAALVASIVFAMLVLVLEFLSRLATATAGGWTP
jgi:hypothetical protein